MWRGDLGEARVQKAAGKVLLRLLQGCVDRGAAGLCLQPCRKEPFTENQWYHISEEPVPSAGEQTNL